MSLIDAKWLEILKARGWQTSALAVACLVFYCLVRFGFIPVSENPLWLTVPIALALVSGALAIASIIASAAKFFRLRRRFAQWLQRRHDQERLRKYIPFMSNDEKRILGYLLYHRQKTFLAELSGGYAVGLISKGFIRRGLSPGQAFDTNHVPFNVPEHLWSVLQEHQDCFPYAPPEDGVEKHPWAIHWMAR